ncbi:MAG: hypothetical protein JST22_06895 [Bacteroidetes bacterium]|nr:hypothetical protein [Bacteroidota bacterium]
MQLQRNTRRDELPIPTQKLRRFASGLAQLCVQVGIIDYDIACEFTLRKRPEYASVAARSRAGGHMTLGEDIILVVSGSPEPDNRTAG